MDRDANTHWTLWAALAGSVPIYGFVLIFLSGSGHDPEPLEPMIPLVLLAVGGGTALGSLTIGRVVPLTKQWMTACILRWALGEATALFGFVLGFLGGPPVLVACLMLAGGLLIVGQPPTAAARASFEDAARR